MSGTHGILLAGVHRWDDASLDRFLPRPVLPIGNTLLISYALRWLRDAGVTRATICANSASRLIRQLLGDGARLSMDIDYYEDWTPRGPGGCVRDAVSEADADQFVVVYATLIPQMDLPGALAGHERRRSGLTVVANCEVTPGGSSEYRPVGIYVFSRDAAERIPETGYQDLKEILIPRLRRDGKNVSLLSVRESSPRVTGLDSYLVANEWLLRRLNNGAYALRGYERAGETWIHPSAKIAEGVRLVGPVMIGPGTQIERDAVVVGPSVLGAGNRVGRNAVVARSVVWDRARVGEGAFLDRCVVTNDGRVADDSRANACVIAPDRDIARPMEDMRQVLEIGAESTPARTPATVAGGA